MSLVRVQQGELFWLHGQVVKTPPFHGGNRGSNPLGVTDTIYRIWLFGKTGILHLVYDYADVAQLAEQLICNQQVIGSSPIIGFMDL